MTRKAPWTTRHSAAAARPTFDGIRSKNSTRPNQTFSRIRHFILEESMEMMCEREQITMSDDEVAELGRR